MMRISNALRYAIIVSLGGFIFGFDASVISGAIGSIVTEFNLNSWQQGFVVASPTLGAIIATFTAGAICDAIGRRKVLLIIAFLYLISAIASAFAVNYWMLVSARMLGGLAFCSLMIAPMYIAEISKAEARGRMVSINQLNIVVGFSAAYFANYYILQLSQSNIEWVQALGIDSSYWRWMLGAEIVPALCYFLLLFSIPETPRWLIVNKQEEKGNAILTKLFGQQDAQAQYLEIKDSVAAVVPPLSKRIATLFSASMMYALAIGLIVSVSQQITGINSVFFYAPSIFEQSGIGTNASFIQAIWIGITNVVFTIVAMLCIDRFGRKPLLIIGLSGVVLSLSLCAYGFKQATYTLDQQDLLQAQQVVAAEKLADLVDVTFDSDVAYKNALIERLGEQTFNANQGRLIELAAEMNAMLILIGILGFVASFALSLGPVMWVMFSEIFPNQIRGIAISFVGVINSLTSFTVQLVFPWELATIGSAMTFMLYALSGLVGLILVILYVPETKGKSLEQLEKILTGNRGKDRTHQA